MSRADFERGWRCACKEIARQLEAREKGSEAVIIAECATPNVGAQRSEVGVTTLTTLASPVGCSPVSTAEAKLFARMRSGGQVAETCGVFRLTERGRAELL